MDVVDALDRRAARRRTADPGWASGLGRALVQPLWKRLASLGRARSEVQLEVVETLALGARRQLFLIVCGGERYLVGAGTDTVGSIVRLADAGQPGGSGDRG